MKQSDEAHNIEEIMNVGTKCKFINLKPSFKFK